MLRILFHAFTVTTIFFSRHFETVGDPNNAFSYGQTLEGFLVVCAFYLMTLLAVSWTLWKAGMGRHYGKSLSALLLISILPLLDLLYPNIVSILPLAPGLTRKIYSAAVLAYIPAVILACRKLPIERYVGRATAILSVFALLTLIQALPRSFSTNG